MKEDEQRDLGAAASFSPPPSPCCNSPPHPAVDLRPARGTQTHFHIGTRDTGSLAGAFARTLVPCGVPRPEETALGHTWGEKEQASAGHLPFVLTCEIFEIFGPACQVQHILVPFAGLSAPHLYVKQPSWVPAPETPSQYPNAWLSSSLLQPGSNLMQVLQTRLTLIWGCCWPCGLCIPLRYGQGMCHPGVVLWLGGKKGSERRPAMERVTGTARWRPPSARGEGVRQNR